MKKLSVVLATRNEEKNIGRCLQAVVDIADEIIIVDEYSTDDTENIAKKYGAKVYKEEHHDNFHITKQKAIDRATCEWILQLDADEVVTRELAREITEVINLSDSERSNRKVQNSEQDALLRRHYEILKARDGLGSQKGAIAAYLIPRRNMFLGKPLIHGGVYPDPAVRLIKKGKARLPGKSVHEMMVVDGRIAWLVNDMEHHDSPTLSRYFVRLNRYTSLQANELLNNKLPKNFLSFVNFVLVKPVYTFFNLYLRHRGYLDGMRGFMWSALSASHFPIAYFKYVTN